MLEIGVKAQVTEIPLVPFSSVGPALNVCEPFSLRQTERPSSGVAVFASAEALRVPLIYSTKVYDDLGTQL